MQKGGHRSDRSTRCRRGVRSPYSFSGSFEADERRPFRCRPVIESSANFLLPRILQDIPLFASFLNSFKLFRRNNLQFRKNFGDALATSQHAGIGDIDENILDRRVVKRFSSAEINDAFFLEDGRGSSSTIPILIRQIKNAANCSCFQRIYLNVKQFPILFPDAAFFTS